MGKFTPDVSRIFQALGCASATSASASDGHKPPDTAQHQDRFRLLLADVPGDVGLHPRHVPRPVGIVVWHALLSVSWKKGGGMQH